MRFDTIVFSQRELCEAVGSGCRYIAVCDNEFTLPSEPDMHYTAIGDVSAAIPVTEKAAAETGITFDGFVPEFEAPAPEYALVQWRDESLSIGGGSFGSFMSSYASSFLLTSFSGSYGSFGGSYFHWYEYEYEYERVGSYAGSFSGSYGSFGGSHSSLYGVGSYRDPYAHIINPFIFVNGYGIDLI